MSALLTPQERATIDAIGKVLIPAAFGMPDAVTAGATGEHLDRVFALRPDLRELSSRAARVAAEAPVEGKIKTLIAADPEAFAALGEAIAAAYYMAPEVRLLIGYPGQERREIPPDDDLSPQAKAMLDRVIARGPIYRHV